MSQLIKHVKANEDARYLFKIALDHAPEQGEVDGIEARIQNAMMMLGVPAEQVGVAVFKSALPPGADVPQEEQPRILGDDDEHYLLCILIRTEEGGFTEDPSSVAERTVRAFSTFADLPAENISAVVLEDAYLEVETRVVPSISGVNYDRFSSRQGPRRR